jgi:hypothetical protein
MLSLAAYSRPSYSCTTLFGMVSSVSMTKFCISLPHGVYILLCSACLPLVKFMPVKFLTHW